MEEIDILGKKKSHWEEITVKVRNKKKTMFSTYEKIPILGDQIKTLKCMDSLLDLCCNTAKLDKFIKTWISLSCFLLSIAPSPS